MKLIFPIKSIPGIILWKSFIQIVFLCYLQTYKLYSVFVNENQCWQSFLIIETNQPTDTRTQSYYRVVYSQKCLQDYLINLVYKGL